MNKDIVRIESLLIDLKYEYKYLDDTKKELFVNSLIVLAKSIGVKIPIKDNRNMFLVLDSDDNYLTSTHSFQEASDITLNIQGSKYHNRTHPKCPKKALLQFDNATNFKDTINND